MNLHCFFLVHLVKQLARLPHRQRFPGFDSQWYYVFGRLQGAACCGRSEFRQLENNIISNVVCNEDFFNVKQIKVCYRLCPEMKQFLSNRRRDTKMNWFESTSDWEQELARCAATGWRVSSVNDRFEMSTR